MSISISEKTVAKFISENLMEATFREFEASPDLAQVVEEVKNGNEIKAAELYVKARSASIDEAHLVVYLLINFSALKTATA